MRNISLVVSFVLSCLLAPLYTQAEIKWNNPQTQDVPVINGQAWPEALKKTYQRIPESQHGIVPDYVWGNSLHSAGLNIKFYSNSPEIRVRYTVTGSFAMQHMPATGVSGVDLYATDCNGATNICAGSYSFKDTVEFTYSGLTYKNMHNRGSEYTLFLPPFNRVSWMEIGVPEGNEFAFIPRIEEKPIVVYGTSIAHGGCASRPGMIWTNIVQRNLETPVINLGFSGSGRLDSSVFALLSTIDAKLFIIDCMPNMVDDRSAWIVKRMVDGVKMLRSKSDAPILIVEHDGYAGEFTSQQDADRYKNSNIECKKAYEALQKEGVKNLSYMTHEEIAMNPDGQVDGTHATDLGMMDYAKAYTKKIREILDMPVGTVRTTIPCKQRREPDNYEWNKRHAEILALNKQRAPEIVLIGNSITHFWGGEPVFRNQFGKETFAKLFKNKVVTNMGFGFDMIENALWRVYHGELDGYKAKKVFMMIGTNNVNRCPDKEIVDGLVFLIKEVQQSQPEAVIHVVSIYARRNDEEHLRKLNGEIRAALTEGPLLKYVDVFDTLLKSNGKIDESFFIGDGLHPNEKGYAKVAEGMKAFVK